MDLSSDGFYPHGKGKDYSGWLVVVTPYNLTTTFCNNRPYTFLSFLIIDPSHPRKHIDVHLKPLVDKLKSKLKFPNDYASNIERRGTCKRTCILCNNDKIFPPKFFDSMKHLIVHLPYEANVCIYSTGECIPLSGICV